MILLCVHDIVLDRPQLTWEMNAGDLESVIHALHQRGYIFSTLGRLAEPPARTCILTVDDGAAGAAGWLLGPAADMGIPGVFFVVVDWLDNPPPRSPDHAYRGLASWDQVARAQEAGHEIGSHSMTHRRLPGLDAGQVEHELRGSKRRIEDMLGSEIRHFAAPFGALSDGISAAARGAGYRTVCSTVPGVNQAAEQKSGVLRRFLIRSDMPRFGLPEWLVP